MTTDENSLERALEWRMQIVKELAKMITDIQADNLDEHRIRDMNDQINRKMRLKRAWEHRIVELGGPNYLGVHPTQFVDVGVAPDMKGGAYRYYGAAKGLPGVKELLRDALGEGEGKRKTSRSVEQLWKHAGVAYFGYLDDEDGVLEEEERKAQKIALEKAHAEWEKSQSKKRQKKDNGEEEEEEEETRGAFRYVDEGFKAHVTLPTQEEIDALIVERKKRDLLKMYATPELQKQLQDTASKMIK